jgi:UDP-N-acetylmuramoyl-tripeptide--D-alanyl-D-alanine ligase
MMTLAQAHALLPGSTLVGDGALVVQRVHSDTRSLQRGDLFVALKGERFDAHDFLPQARAAGAVAALAEHGLDSAKLPGLRVDDALSALQELAAGWRQRHTGPLITVAGSNGKTTVTQMIAAIQRAWVGEAAALATAGNLNNHIGVPLTLLRLRPEHRSAVVELGMNHPGEIALLARLAAPTVALVNNAQREHQEFMASVEAVARENGHNLEALAAGGTAVVPAGDAYTALWREMAGARPVMTFALDGRADVTATAAWAVDHWAMVLHTPVGSTVLALRVAGRHNATNALAATACALAAGAPLAAVVRGLQAFEPVAGRSRALLLQRAGRRVTLVDDSYNANPDSVLAAIEVLAELPGPRWLLLGDMGEVGERGAEFHAEVGARARERGIDHFWAAGALCAHAATAFGPGARHFASAEQALAALSNAPASTASAASASTPPAAPEAASILVKGSRFMKMERLVQVLKTPPEAACS